MRVDIKSQSGNPTPTTIYLSTQKKKVVVWNVEVKWIWPWLKCYVHCFTPHHSANSIYHDFHILVTAFLIGLAAAVFYFFIFRSDWARGKSVWAPSRVREIKSDCVIFDKSSKLRKMNEWRELVW